MASGSQTSTSAPSIITCYRSSAVQQHRESSNSSNPLYFTEKVVLSPNSGRQKRIFTVMDQNTAEMSKGSKAKKAKKVKVSGQSDASQGTSSPSNDSDVSQSDNDSPIQDEEDLEGTPFEIEVKKSLRCLTRAFFGDKRSHFRGLVGRVEDVETDLYGGNNPDRGIKTRFENLENTVKSMSSSCTSATGSVSTVAAPAADVVQQLTRSNEVLAGFATLLQMENKSLRNSL